MLLINLELLVEDHQDHNIGGFSYFGLLSGFFFNIIDYIFLDVNAFSK